MKIQTQNSTSQKVPVSVILPCYKHEDVLDRAIGSIANQSTTPQQVIVVNDGGSQGISAKVLNLIARYPSLNLKEIILKNNLGASLARNEGWDMALGRYVAFLDADDSWHPRKLEIQYQFMEENPDVTLCGHQYRQENPDQKNVNWTNYLISNKFEVINLWRLLVVNQFITPSVMIRNNSTFRFSKYQTHMEDHQLWMHISQDGNKIVKLQSELACIFKSPFGESGLSSNLLRMELGEIQAYYSICSKRIALFPLLLILIPYSLIKFARRIFIQFVIR